MPKVGNKEFAYDEAGMDEAKKEAAKTGESIEYKGYADGGVVDAQNRSKKVEGYYGGGMVNPANRIVDSSPTPGLSPRMQMNRLGLNKGGKVKGCK